MGTWTRYVPYVALPNQSRAPDRRGRSTSTAAATRMIPEKSRLISDRVSLPSRNQRKAAKARDRGGAHPKSHARRALHDGKADHAEIKEQGTTGEPVFRSCLQHQEAERSARDRPGYRRPSEHRQREEEQHVGRRPNARGRKIEMLIVPDQDSAARPRTMSM